MYSLRNKQFQRLERKPDSDTNVQVLKQQKHSTCTRYLGLLGVWSNSSDCNMFKVAWSDCNMFNVAWSFTMLFCLRSLAFNSNGPNPGRSETELPLVAAQTRKRNQLFKNNAVVRELKFTTLSRAKKKKQRNAWTHNHCAQLQCLVNGNCRD